MRTCIQVSHLHVTWFRWQDSGPWAWNGSQIEWYFWGYWERVTVSLRWNMNCCDQWATYPIHYFLKMVPKYVSFKMLFWNVFCYSPIKKCSLFPSSETWGFLWLFQSAEYSASATVCLLDWVITARLLLWSRSSETLTLWTVPLDMCSQRKWSPCHVYHNTAGETTGRCSSQ